MPRYLGNVSSFSFKRTQKLLQAYMFMNVHDVPITQSLHAARQELVKKAQLLISAFQRRSTHKHQDHQKLPWTYINFMEFVIMQSLKELTYIVSKQEPTFNFLPRPEIECINQLPYKLRHWKNWFAIQHCSNKRTTKEMFYYFRNMEFVIMQRLNDLT